MQRSPRGRSFHADNKGISDYVAAQVNWLISQLNVATLLSFVSVSDGDTVVPANVGVLADAGDGSFTLNLESDANAGNRIVIFKVDDSDNVVTAAGHELRSVNATVTLLADGTQWRVQVAYDENTAQTAAQVAALAAETVTAVVVTANAVNPAVFGTSYEFTGNNPLAVTLPVAPAAGAGEIEVKIAHGALAVITVTPPQNYTIDGQATLVVTGGGAERTLRIGTGKTDYEIS